MVVYSVASQSSFDALPKMINQVQGGKKQKKFPMILVATQGNPSSSSHIVADCTKREVTEKEGRSLAFKYSCPYLEVSAKTGYNIPLIFSTVVQQITKYPCTFSMGDSYKDMPAVELEKQTEDVSVLLYTNFS